MKRALLGMLVVIGCLVMIQSPVWADRPDIELVKQYINVTMRNTCHLEVTGEVKNSVGEPLQDIVIELDRGEVYHVEYYSADFDWHTWFRYRPAHNTYRGHVGSDGALRKVEIAIPYRRSYMPMYAGIRITAEITVDATPEGDYVFEPDSLSITRGSSLPDTPGGTYHWSECNFTALAKIMDIPSQFENKNISLPIPQGKIKSRIR